jgi:hypothetical protein
MAYADVTDGSRVIIEGEGACKITLGEACKPGDLLGYSSGWKRALATVGTAIYARLVAGEAGDSGDEITAYKMAVVSGVSGATPGNAIYLAEGTSYGGTTETAPSTAGDINTIIGRALTSTTILLFPDVKADSVA